MNRKQKLKELKHKEFLKILYKEAKESHWGFRGFDSIGELLEYYDEFCEEEPLNNGEFLGCFIQSLQFDTTSRCKIPEEDIRDEIHNKYAQFLMFQVLKG